MAVAVLLAIAAVLAWGTFYEGRFGTAAVQQTIYRSLGFQFLLFFLGVNLAAAALQRLPWKRKHLPFVLAHIGILLILTGGILSARLGVEGTLMIPEGESGSMLELSRSVLVVTAPRASEGAAIPTAFEARAWVHEPGQRWPVTLAGRSLEVSVDRYFPDARRVEQVTEASEEENPALQVELRRGEQTDQIWLFSRNPHRAMAVSDPMTLLYLETTPEWIRQRVGRSDGPSLPSQAVIFCRLPSGSVSALLTGVEGRPERIDDLEVGKFYRHPALDLDFRLLTQWKGARLITDYENRSDRVRAETLRVTVREGEERRMVWVPRDALVPVPLSAGPLFLQYRADRRPIPFAVRLLDFRKHEYPGTTVPAAFESDLVLADPERGETRRTASMNNPVKHRGWILFQSSYIEGPTEATVLLVRNDPGTPVVYTGFLIVIVGVITLFTSRERRQ